MSTAATDMTEEREPLLDAKKAPVSLLYVILKLVACAFAVGAFLLYVGNYRSLRISGSSLMSTTTEENGDRDAQRIVMYYSPNEEEANDFDLIELLNQDNLNPDTGSPYITHIEISTLHLKQYDDAEIHLNDLSPHSSRFTALRQNIASLQEYGVKVLFMLGGWESISGAAPDSDSSFVNLFQQWDIFYPKLVQLIELWNVDGLDIDIENYYDDDENEVIDNFENICKLIFNLKSDFGASFILAMSPVAEALFTDDQFGGLSGFSYKQLVLESEYGQFVDQLNVQFYDGWGSLEGVGQYEECIDSQGYPASLLVAGMLEADKDDISDAVTATVKRLSTKYGDEFGGVAVYYGNTAHIVSWSKNMYHLINQD